MDLEQDIARIAQQERRLRFASFNEDAAWELGSRLRALALVRQVAVAIEVRMARETVFFHAMPGTTAANADWARRKRNTTELLSRSSYGVGRALEKEGSTLEAKMGLPTRDYASHGGSVALLTTGGACIGAVTVSGLPQREDHSLVIEVLAALCSVPLSEIALARHDTRGRSLAGRSPMNQR
jgi:uncharacterized protein (UPF0303 family)